MRAREAHSSTSQALNIGRFFVVLTALFATHAFGQTTLTAPTITKQPVSQRLDYGQTLLLTVEATGSGPLTYEWKKYAAVLPQKTPYFTLEHVSPGDNGQYTVTVSNAAGAMTSAIAYIIVEPATPPVFNQHPLSQSVLYDGTFRLSAAVNGAAPTTYQWYKNDVYLTATTTPNLEITHARPTQSGDYRVVATNFGGSTSSDVATIRVFDPSAPVISQQPQSANANSSEIVTFTVAYTQTNVGPVSLQWFHDGRAIAGATSDSLIIRNPLETAYGDYTVTIQGAGGSATSVPAHLGPRLVLPQWVSIPQDVTAAVGQRAVMSAGQVYGTEPIQYQWFKDGVAIAGANALTYVIPAVTTADYGSYTLQISNVVGARTSIPARLLPPSSIGITILVQPQSLTIVARKDTMEPLLSTAATTTSGALTYEWYHNGFRYNNATGAIMTDSATPWAVGLYQAVIANGTARALSVPVIIGFDAKDIYTRPQPVAANIHHANGNVYDQYALNGSLLTVSADPGEVARVSFVDLNDDIVQVELAGAGTLTARMTAGVSSTLATLYNQPGVQYGKGHVALTIAGADETTHLNVFTVGRNTALDQNLFKDGVRYDGVADIAYVAILSRNGKFGGLHLGNTHFFATLGFTGVYAPGVAFTGAVNIGDIEARDTAQPVLCIGSAEKIQMTGGNLEQPNFAPIRVSSIVPITFAAGATSNGDILPAQLNAGRFEKDGVDVTTSVTP